MVRRDGPPASNTRVRKGGARNSCATPSVKVRLPSPAAAVGMQKECVETPTRRGGATAFNKPADKTVENMSEAKLCLPAAGGTLLSSFLVAKFRRSCLLEYIRSRLLHFIGWPFLFYIPAHFVAIPFTRNFVLWSLRSGALLDGTQSVQSLLHCRTRLLPYVLGLEDRCPPAKEGTLSFHPHLSLGNRHWCRFSWHNPMPSRWVLTDRKEFWF